jgi:flagellar hook-length control protein FliK
MMQHIATAKSELAAFATGTDSNSVGSSGANDQFGNLLQDQKSLHSTAVASESPSPHSPRKKALQQSLDEIDKAPSKTKEDTIRQSKSISSERSESLDAQASNSPQKPATEDNASDKVTDHANTVAELVLSSKDNDIDIDHIDAQEWVVLVDNLQKLADSAQLIDNPLDDAGVHSLSDSVIDSKLSNSVDKSLQEQIASLKTTDNVIATQNKQSLGQADKVDGEVVRNEGLGPIFTKVKNQPDLAVVIQQTLEKLSAKVEGGQGSSSDTQSTTAELLLEQPEVLQGLLNQLQVASQKGETGTVEQKTLDTAIDNVVNKGQLLASPQIEAEEPLDVTIAENKALLRALLVDSDIGKKPVQGPVKLAMPEAPEKLVQVQQTDALVTKLESVAEQGELLEQDAQLAQVTPNNFFHSSKTEKVTSNNDVKNILNLTDNKLDKVLENIAQKVFDSKKTDEPIKPEQIASQVVIPKVAEIISSVDSPSKDFISALKSGLDEFKNQLSQGREPGIDLKALVSDALAKTTDTGSAAKTTINIEQAVNSVSQLLDFAQTMNQAIDQHHDQVYNATLRDVAQIQGEQSKQIQFNQFESKFEKAINITKPEGHQQLAEKVRWMVNTKNLVAEIRLDPAELGSVHVKVAVSGESATVNFVVQSQQARDAVDTATPRLREMLAEKGIELGQSSVRQESDGQGQGEGELAGQGGRGNDESEDVEVPQQVVAQQNIVNGALGGIDYFV